MVAESSSIDNTPNDVEAQRPVYEPKYDDSVNVSPLKNHMIAFLGEFFGTFIFYGLHLLLLKLLTKIQPSQIKVLIQCN